jgi:hypothetical protein
MNARKTWPLAALALVLAAAGCGSSRLVKVTGRLTYKGQPVPSTRVTFWPDEGGRRSTGVTDDNGYFSLKYSRTEQGVTRGRHTVYLTYEVSNEEELGQIAPKASKELKEVIARHGDLKTSKLHYEVKGNGQVIDINLD